MVLTEYSKLESGLNAILYFGKWFLIKVNVLGWEVVQTEYSRIESESKCSRLGSGLN